MEIMTHYQLKSIKRILDGFVLTPNSDISDVEFCLSLVAKSAYARHLQIVSLHQQLPSGRSEVRKRLILLRLAFEDNSEPTEALLFKLNIISIISDLAFRFIQKLISIEDFRDEYRLYKKEIKGIDELVQMIYPITYSLAFLGESYDPSLTEVLSACFEVTDRIADYWSSVIGT